MLPEMQKDAKETKQLAAKKKRKRVESSSSSDSGRLCILISTLVQVFQVSAKSKSKDLGFHHPNNLVATNAALRMSSMPSSTAFSLLG